MGLVINDLADKLKGSLGFSGLPTSKENNGLAKGIVSELQAAGIVTNASGTITGTAPSSGGPLGAGAGTNGIISGIAGPSLAGRIQAASGYPSVSPELLKFATAITDHVKIGRVIFVSGTITGGCTNTTDSPGVFTGTGQNGMIVGLSGSTLGQKLASAIGQATVSPQLAQFAITLVTYIMTNAKVSYSSVTGIAPSSGGPISAGMGTGGKIA